MKCGMANFFEGSSGRTFARSFYAAGLALTCLLWGLLFDAETYVNVEYGFSLVAAIGAIGCLGHLAAYAYRNSGYISSACSVLSGVRPLELRRSCDVHLDNTDWPLLVALLFGPFSMLLSGLGGWV
ncbi:hypothetical protein BH24ACT22_BH24ACT22_18700 [soil metagenome]